jgi:hypothetical protein
MECPERPDKSVKRETPVHPAYPAEMDRKVTKDSLVIREPQDRLE